MNADTDHPDPTLVTTILAGLADYRRLRGLCPVCGRPRPDRYGHVCTHCGWEHDPGSEAEPDGYCWGPNGQLTLNEYREQWLATK